MPLVLAGLAVGLFVTFGVLVMYSMMRGAHGWLVPMVDSFFHRQSGVWGRALGAAYKYTLGPAAHFVYRNTMALMGWFIHAIIKPAVHFVHSLGVLVGELADLILDFPAEVHWALHYLRHIAIPRLILAAIGPLRTIALDAKALALALERDATAVAGSVADALNGIGWATSLDFFGAIRNLAHAFAHLWRYVYGEITSSIAVLKAEAAVLGRDAEALSDYVRRELAKRLAGAEAAIGALEKTVYGELKAFIDALKEGVIPAAMLGAITLALAKVWDGIFCRNTNAVGKKLCGLDSALLDAFLIGVTADLALGGLDELIRELQAVVGETAAGVRALAEV